jgi:hypothetical protein
MNHKFADHAHFEFEANRTHRERITFRWDEARFFHGRMVLEHNHWEREIRNKRWQYVIESRRNTLYFFSAALTAERMAVYYYIKAFEKQPDAKTWFREVLNANPVFALLKDLRDAHTKERPFNYGIGWSLPLVSGEDPRETMRKAFNSEEFRRTMMLPGARAGITIDFDTLNPKRISTKSTWRPIRLAGFPTSLCR